MKVSIIIPCYNAEKWVRQCIVSALEQDYDSFEVIAVDNESTDNTLQIIGQLKMEFPQLKTGTAPNLYKYCWDEPRDEALKMATGDYMTILGADDYLDKSYISNCMKFISTNPKKIKIFQSAIRGVDDNGTFKGDISHFYSSIEEFKRTCLSTCPVTTPTVIYNMDLWRSGIIKTYPEEYSGASDYASYCQLAHDGYFIYPANRWLGYYYRWHPNQATWSMHKEPIKYDEKIQNYWSEKWKPATIK